MARTSRKRGAVEAIRGKLYFRIYWRHPKDPIREYRWSIATNHPDTPENRQQLEQRLELLNAKLQGGAFFPCQEFPGSKIASFCHCGNCAAVEPLDNAYEAPSTLGALLRLFEAHEQRRAQGEGQRKKVIEASTFETKKTHMAALRRSFTHDDGHTDLALWPALTDYAIVNLTPEAVTQWLTAFQHREELLSNGKPPATTKYMNDLASVIRQALRYGQYRRWWRTHPLLEYTGGLLEATKEERSRRANKSQCKPFTLVDRDRILGWFHDAWENCPTDAYNGREKPRLLFLYHYMVIGFNTGLRSPSEMTALEWSDVDFTNQVLHVRKSREASGAISRQIVRKYTKTIKHREVPLNDMALQSLRALLPFRQEEADWIFWNPRADISNPFQISNGWAPLTGEKRIRYQFEKCLKELGIPSPDHQGQYRMRHTFTTLVLDHTTLEDAQVAAWIGDTVETMKNHYQGHCRKRWRNAADRVQLNALNAVGSGKLRAVK